MQLNSAEEERNRMLCDLFTVDTVVLKSVAKPDNTKIIWNKPCWKNKEARKIHECGDDLGSKGPNPYDS